MPPHSYVPPCRVSSHPTRHSVRHPGSRHPTPRRQTLKGCFIENGASLRLNGPRASVSPKDKPRSHNGGGGGGAASASIGPGPGPSPGLGPGPGPGPGPSPGPGPAETKAGPRRRGRHPDPCRLTDRDSLFDNDVLNAPRSLEPAIMRHLAIRSGRVQLKANDRTTNDRLPAGSGGLGKCPFVTSAPS